MTRVYNFSPGPAALPEPVLRQAAAEMLDWHGSGMGVMEMSHRGKEFISIYEAAERDLRELLGLGGAVDQTPLQRALRALMQNRTTFIIAHRLSTLHDVDRILVIDGGRLVEEGRHDDLLRRGGLYAGLYDAQFQA